MLLPLYAKTVVVDAESDDYRTRRNAKFLFKLYDYIRCGFLQVPRRTLEALGYIKFDCYMNEYHDDPRVRLHGGASSTSTAVFGIATYHDTTT